MPRPRKSPLRSIPILDLAAELRSRQSELPALMNRYVEIVEELGRVESMITALGGTFDPKHPRLRRRGPGRPTKPSAAKVGRKARGGRAKNDGSLSDALAKVLTGKTMLIADAGEAVRKAGYKTGSKHFRTMVNIALLNKKRFKRVERGMYTAM